MDDLIRIMVLDDAPTFKSIKIRGLTSFESEPPEHRYLYERNFDLSWQYDINDALKLHNRIVVALETKPEELLTATRYPNILWMDYKFDKTPIAETTLRDNPAARAEYDRVLNPLRGDWGNNYQELPLSDEEWASYGHIKTADLPAYPGVEAGLRIFDRLRDFACFPIAQTGHIDPPETRLQEKFAAIDVGQSIRQKYGVLGNWFEFLAKALPQFRKRLAFVARRGSMAPRLIDLSNATRGESDLYLDRSLSWQSSLGTEAFRVEALFFDKIYQFDKRKMVLTKRPPETARKEFDTWAKQVVAAAAGPRALNTISIGLRLADEFRTAHASENHLLRRALSRELGDVITQEERRVMDVRLRHKKEAEPRKLESPQLMKALLEGRVKELRLSADFEADLAEARAATRRQALAAAEQNKELLAEFGFSPGVIAKGLVDRSIYDLEIDRSRRARWGVLRPITAEAKSNTLVVRYAALSLMIYAEFAWIARQVGDPSELRELLIGLERPEFCELRDPISEVERIAAPILGVQAARELRRSVDRQGKVPLEVFNRLLMSGLLAEREDLDATDIDIVEDADRQIDHDEQEPENSATPADSQATIITEADQKFALVLDLLSPAPTHLLHWRDRTRNAAQGIYRPFERQEHPLNIKGILEGDIDSDMGLERGEGRIISVIAAHLGFDRLYWPVWMRRAEKGC